MNIFSFFKNLFKKDEVIKSTDIVSIRDLVSVRTRNELFSNELVQLNEYKSEYLDKLKDKVLFSKDLDITNFKERMDMYLELVVNLFLNEDSVFENIDQYNEQLDLIVKAKKKDLYLQNIIDILKELELRIIALEEILNSTNSFNISKKRIVKNKLDNLVVLFNVFKTQGEAIFIDANANIEMSKSISDISENDILILKKAKLVEKMFTLMVSPDKLLCYMNMKFESIYDKIAF